jgi:hypothetical protein
MEKRLKNIQTFEQHSSELNISDVSDSRLHESKSEKNIVDKFFKIFGLDISDDGIVKVSNRMGKLLCNMAVREKYFEKLDDNTYKLK